MISAVLLAATLVGTPGLGLSIAPAQVVGQASSQASFVYVDKGTTNENVRVQAVELKPVTVKGQHGWSPYGEADYARVTPERFSLKPGQRQVIQVIMDAKDGVTHNVAILATATEVAPNHTTGGRVSASVGARYIVKAESHAAGHNSGSVPLVPVVATSLLLGLLAALGRYLQLKRRRRTT